VLLLRTPAHFMCERNARTKASRKGAGVLMTRLASLQGLARPGMTKQERPLFYRMLDDQVHRLFRLSVTRPSTGHPA
jgi:hypothetical protein